MGATAAIAALADAGVAYSEVQQAYVGYVYGDSGAGQKALYRVGMTGIPVCNVNNNCSTGSSALFLARQAVGERRDRLRAGAGLRADDAGRARHALQRPSYAFRRLRSCDRCARRRARRPDGDTLLRRRGPRAHEEVRHDARDVRPHSGEGLPPRDEQSARALPARSRRRRSAGVAGADALA